MYAISYYNGPRYNGIRLYFKDVWNGQHGTTFPVNDIPFSGFYNHIFKVWITDFEPGLPQPPFHSLFYS